MNKQKMPIWIDDGHISMMYRQINRDRQTDRQTDKLINGETFIC